MAVIPVHCSHRLLIQSLNVLKNMLKTVPAGGDFVLGEAIKHEGIVGVGRMAQA